MITKEHSLIVDGARYKLPFRAGQLNEVSEGRISIYDADHFPVIEVYQRLGTKELIDSEKQVEALANYIVGYLNLME